MTELKKETKAILEILISEMDDYLRNPDLTDGEKLTKIEVLLYSWIMGNKLCPWKVEKVEVGERG